MSSEVQPYAKASCDCIKVELPVVTESIQAGFPAPNGGYIDGKLDVFCPRAFSDFDFSELGVNYRHYLLVFLRRSEMPVKILRHCVWNMCLPEITIGSS